MSEIPVLTLEQMRQDIAEVLGEDPASIVPGENLVDYGLDSIRLMRLAERWSVGGARVGFEDLADMPELEHWWETVTRRRGGKGQ